MSDLEERKWQLIEDYTNKFDEGPPIWGMDDERAVKLMEAAIKADKKIDDDGAALPSDHLT